MLARVAVTMAVLCPLAGAAEAQAQRRVALVIGQGAYANLTELSNPKLDARRMAAILATHGFEVIACDVVGLLLGSDAPSAARDGRRPGAKQCNTRMGLMCGVQLTFLVARHRAHRLKKLCPSCCRDGDGRHLLRLRKSGWRVVEWPRAAE
jgi:hypothetical protein